MPMTFTRPFRDTVKARLAREPAFRQALLAEAVNMLTKGDVEPVKDILRDFDLTGADERRDAAMEAERK